MDPLTLPAGIQGCPKVVDRWLACTYIGAGLLFIFSLNGLSKHKTSQRGTWYGIVGMATAIVATLASDDVVDEGYWLAFVGMVPGAIVGVVMAVRVQMTSMPQMVGILNAFGGLAAALSGIALYVDDGRLNDVLGARLDRGGYAQSEREQNLTMFELILGVVVGTLTFTGSLVACAKLQGVIRSKPLQFTGRFAVYLLHVGGIVAMGSLAGIHGTPPFDNNDGIIYLVVMSVLSGSLGVLWVLGIGGADMPVVVSVLNSFSGWSGVAAGFMLRNDLLIITGTLVGSSGAILSYIMCVAMARSLANVLKGGFGDGAPKKSSGGGDDGDATTNLMEKEEVTKATVEEVAARLNGAKRVLITPGYGMAVSRAQHTISEIQKILKSRGVALEFGIHPVAGRLPGHMNVLLAEANLPYDVVLEMDEVNPHMEEYDVAMVIGANDTVNPAAQEDPNSPIAGMPVIEVWRAKKVIVMKRGMGKGYSGAQNPLFFRNVTDMLFGDAKKNADLIATALRAMESESVSVDMSTGGKASAGAGSGADDGAVMGVQSLDEPEYETFRAVGVPREVHEGERRVALSPAVAKMLLKKGFDVVVESGAGVSSSFDDQQYSRIGCTVVPTAREVWDKAEIILKVQAPEEHPELGHEADLVVRGKTLIAYLWPRQDAALVERLTKAGGTAMATDMVPRISRAQKLDTLSSQAKVGGYRAIVEAANHFERFFVGEITAAGKTPPAKVLVIGAGVAGLSAIGTAKSMGAVVRAFDTRPEVKEQVESMGAEFLEVDMEEDADGGGGYAKVMSPEFIEAEMALFAEQAKDIDIVVTTAQIPGRRAPLLYKAYHVEAMKYGSVVVDMAALSGGNVEVTKPGEIYQYGDTGVTIIGLTNLPSRMAAQASQMYATNLYHLLCDMGGGKDFHSDFDDVVVRNMTVCREGECTFPPPDIPRPSPPQKKTAPPDAGAGAPRDDEEKHTTWVQRGVWMGAALALLVFTAVFAPDSFVPHLTVFALAFVIGWTVIWGVAPALHTPLMSVTNAISGVVVAGAIALVNPDHVDAAAAGDAEDELATRIISMVAIFVASINVFGGFKVTLVMLRMFRK